MMLYLSLSTLFTGMSAGATNKPAFLSCPKVKVGQQFIAQDETKKLEANGFQVQRAVAAENGHDTQLVSITVPGSAKTVCSLLVRDGKIAEVRK